MYLTKTTDGAQNSLSDRHPECSAGKIAAPALSEIRDRARWIEQNVLPHEPRIRSWLSRQHVETLDTDDIIQEMYARIGALESYDHIQDPKVYAFKVTHSIILNHLRRSDVVSIDAAGDLKKFEVPAPGASPEDEVSFRDEVQEVSKALASLPRRTRDVLLLRRVEGLSQRETAARLSIAEKTVEKHLAQAAHFLAARFGRGEKRRASHASIKAEKENDDRTE